LTMQASKMAWAVRKAEARNKWAMAHSEVFRAGEIAKVREYKICCRPSPVSSGMGQGKRSNAVPQQPAVVTSKSEPQLPPRSAASLTGSQFSCLGPESVSGIVGTLASGVIPKLPPAPHSNPKFRPLPPLRPAALRASTTIPGQRTRSDSFLAMSDTQSSFGFQAPSQFGSQFGSEAQLPPRAATAISSQRGSQPPPLRQPGIDSSRLTGRDDSMSSRPPAFLLSTQLKNAINNAPAYVHVRQSMREEM